MTHAIHFGSLGNRSKLAALACLAAVLLTASLLTAPVADAAEQAAVGLPSERLETGLHAIRDLVISHDGRRLVVVGQVDFDSKGVLQLWDLQQSKKVLERPATPGGLAVSSDGASVVFKDENGELQLLDAARGVNVHKWESFDRLIDVSFTRDNAVVAAGFNSSSGDERLVSLAVGSAQELFSHVKGKSTMRVFDVFADGTKAVCGTAHGGIFICDLRTGERTMDFAEEEDFDVVGVAASPDGKRIAAKLYASEIDLWDVATGKKTVSLANSGNLCPDILFLADGTTVAGASSHARADTVSLWDAENGDELVVLRQAALGEPGNNRLTHVTAAGDGRRLAACDVEGAVVLWDIGNFVGEPLKIPLAAETRLKPITPPGDLVADATAVTPLPPETPKPKIDVEQPASQPTTSVAADSPPQIEPKEIVSAEKPPVLEQDPPVAAPPVAVAPRKVRTWTSANGKFKVSAAFDSLHGELVYITRDDGSELQIRLDQLSPADRDYVLQQMK